MSQTIATVATTKQIQSNMKLSLLIYIQSLQSRMMNSCLHKFEKHALISKPRDKHLPIYSIAFLGLLKNRLLLLKQLQRIDFKLRKKYKVVFLIR
jgi:hypothetical protein